MPTYAEMRKRLKEMNAQELGTVPDTAQEDAQIERAQVQNALKVSTRPGTERTVLDIYRDMLRPSNADAYAQESRSRIQRQLSRNAQARELLGSKQLSTWNVDESDRALRALDAQGQQQAEFVKRFKTDEDYTHYVKDQAFDEQSKAIASYADWKKGYRQAQADGDAYTAKKYLAWGQNAQDQGTRARAEEIARNATAQQLEKLAKMPTGERNLFRKELEARREQEAQKRQQDASTLRREMNRLYDEIESGFAVDENGEERLLTQAEIIERKNRLNRLQTAQKNAGTEQAGPITLAQYENNQRVAQWEREAQAGQLDTFWNRYMADNGQADAYAQAAEGSYQGDNADAQAINDQLLGIYARINEIDQYEESVWGTEAETGKELQSMQQERAQLQGQAEQLQAEADGKAKEERENARDEQRAARELMYGKASVGRYIKASLMEGATNFANGFYQSLNVLVGKSITAAGRLFDEDYKSGITRFSERYKREVSDKQTAEAEMATQALGGGAALQTGRQVMGSIVENVPNTIMAIMTGGAAAAGGLATAQRAAIASMNQVGTGAAMRVAQGMLGDAQYWTSFMRELGSACDEAEQNGASPLAATLYSTVTALINAGIEVGGGIEKIGQESDPTLIGRALKAATGRDFKALEAILDSAGDEGTEEIKQYIVGALARKAIYDHGLPYYSNEEDAVINPSQMGENAMLGALTGGLLAGGNAAVDALGGAATRTRRQDTAVGESIVSNDWQQTLGHIAQEEAGVNNSTVNKLIAGGQVSLRKLGKLYRETVKNVSEGTKAWFEQSLAKPIAEALRAQGYSGNMELAATAVAKAYGLESYDTLTSKEASILAEPEVKEVLKQLEGGERLDVWEQKETQTPDAKTPVAQEDAAGTENRTQDTGERLTQWEAEQPGSYAAESVLPGTQEAAEIAAETVPETQEMPKEGIKKIPVKTAVKANADERLTQYDAQGGRQHAQTQTADVQNAQTQTADAQSEQTQVDGESYEKTVKRARTLAGAMQTLKVMPTLQRGAITAQDVVESMSVAAVAAEKASISEDGQTHVTVDGQDVVAETVGIAWDQAGTPQLKVRINGKIESVAMDRVRFGSREAATRAMAASTIGGTEAANTLYNAKVQQGTRFLDYARDFMSAYRAAGMGIKKETLRYAGTLTALNELELDAAYEMGRRSASAMAQAKGLNRTEAVRYFKAVLEAAGETNVNGLAAALADAVQRGTVSGAQAELISASPSAQVILQGREVRTDMDGTLTARAYGRSGRSYAELMDTLQGMGMTRGQADSEAVRTAYQQAREQDNARAQRKTARPDTRGGLRDITAQEAEKAGVGVVNREGMSARQQAYTQALEALAGQLGVDMVLYESPVKDGVHVGRDGWYDRSTGTIYIDVEAGYKGEQAMMRVAAHELTHYIEQWNPKGYQSLRDLLLDYYYQKDYDTVRALVQEQLELAQQNGQRIGEAEAMDEVIANACEMMLSDAEAITAIAQKNQTLGKRIRAWIERTLSAMKDALKGLKPHSSAAKLLEKSRETLESARGMWLRALDEISQGEAQQAQETGTQGSQREAQDIATNGIRMGQSDSERYQWLRDMEIEAASVSTEQITPQQIALVNGMGYTKAMPLLEKAAKSYGLIADGQQKAATLQNKHLSIAAEFSKRSLSESLRKQSHAADGNQSTGNGYIAALLPVFKETYENAVPVLVQGDRYRHTVTEQSKVETFVYLLGAFEYGGSTVPVQFELKQLKGDGNRIYVVATIKEAAIMAASFQDTEASRRATTQPLTLSIQDVIANVNPEDTRILANLPSYMLTEEQQAGKREGLKEKGEYLYNKARAAGQDVNAPVKLTQERIDRAIRDYGGSGDYSRAYMAMISPTDFLSLTATDADRIRAEGRVLVAEELRAEQQTPFLQYDPETNEITGHEGRHRMAAMENSHVQETPVLLIPDGSEGRYSRQNVDSLTVSGQRYGARRAQGETTLHSLIPVNEKHRAELEASFGGGEGWFRYSQRDGTLSDRQLLAQAFEGIVRTDADKTRLHEYKTRIEELDTATAQLKSLEAELSDLSSVDWAKDELHKKQQEAQRLRRSIVSADAVLLKMEGTEALQRVAQEVRRAREREIAQQARSEARGTVQRYREGVEKRELANTIKKRTERMARWISQPGKSGSVPKALQASIANFLLGIEQSQNAEFKGEDGRRREKRFRENMMDLVQIVSELQSYQQADAEERIAHDFGGYLDLPKDFSVQMAQVVKSLETAMDRAGGRNAVDEMDLPAMRRLNEMLLTISTSVQQANELLTVKNYKHVSDAARQTISDIRNQGTVKEMPRVFGLDWQGFLQWENTQPVRAFERFGEGGRQIFKALQAGQGQLAFDAQRIIALSEEAYKAEEARAWNKEIKEFTLGENRTVRMPASSLMSLYCLLKRDQAVGHILGEGIRVADFAQGSRHVRGEGTVISLAQAQQMVETLTPRQRAVADRLQQIMSTTGAEWGNYVSMKRFGYEMFTESSYFPIEVDSDRLLAKTDNSRGNELYRLLNISAAKTLTRGAKNRIMLKNIFDVYASHMSDMAQYHAMALPVLDAIKWLNYSEVIENADGTTQRGDSVRDAMRDTLGSGAGRYVQNLIRDISGRQFSGDWGEKAGKALLGRANRQAVAANLRVALLQPTSIVRAGMELGGTEIMLGAARNLTRMRANMEEMQRYSGIAAWKDLGFFDMNISRSIESLIKHTETIGDRVMEKTGVLAEMGDKITWAAMWEGCKENVRRNGARYDTQDAFLRAVAEKFEDVIYKTQVVDSILTRSQLMRSTTLASKWLTSFMSEPTTTYNMLLAAYDRFAAEVRGKAGAQRAEAIRRAWQKHGKTLGRTFAVYGLSAVLSALVESVADAARDNDDYETYIEKWLQAFWGNLGDNLNPLGLLPMVSDLWEIAQGYEPENPLFSGIYTLKESVERAIKYAQGESTAEWYGVAYPLLQGASQVSGLPFATATREVVTLWNNTAAYLDPRLRIEKYQSSAGKGTEALYRAIMEENTGREALLRRQLAANDVSDAKIASGLEKQIRLSLEDGAITEEEARELLTKYGLKKEKGEMVSLTADDAYFKVQKWAYDTDKTEEDADYSPYLALEEAVRTGSGVESAIRELTSHGYSEKAVNNRLKALIRDAYLDGDISERRAGDLLTRYTTKTEDGQNVKLDADDAYWLRKEWKYENGSGLDFSRYTELTDALRAGRNVEGAIQELTGHGHDEKDVAARVKSITGDLYAKGEISRSQAQRLLKKYGRKTSGGMLAALEDTDVWGAMNQMEYKKLTGESSASDYALVYYAISNQQSPQAYIDDALAHGKSRSAIASGLTSRFKEEYQRLLKTDLNAASALKGRLCATFDYLGYNGLKKVGDWEK